MSSGRRSDPFEIAEAIAAKDLNNLYLTSCYFEDRERYRAFCALYAVMRVVDDRIDAIPSRVALTPEQREVEHAVVDAWQQFFEAAAAGGEAPAAAEAAARCDFPQAAVLVAEAAAAMRRFPVPMSLWRNFFGAMHLDIDQARFATYRDFLHYAEGATVAPTTIYLYLIAARSQPAAVAQASAEHAGVYRLPAGFDLLGCGRQLGHFAYLAHILRDLAFDLSTGDEGLLYLARDDMERHGVDEERLFRDLQRQRASAPVRTLVGELIARARQAAAEGRRLAVPLVPHLTPDCAFILELIISMYERVLGKIVDCDGDPLRRQHHLSMAEKGALVQAVARRVGVPAPELPGVPAQ